MTQTTETRPAPFGIAPGEAVAIVHAHPDDELANGAAIDALVDAGVAVHTIVATDGEASDRGDQDELRQGLRLREAQAAFKEYGIPPERQHYLRLPDGALSHPNVLEMLSRHLQDMLPHIGATAIITPGEYGFDGHSDHQAVHVGSVAASRQLRAQGISIRAWGLTEEGDVHIPVNRALKLTRLALHASQFDIPFGGSELPAKTAELLAPYDKLLNSHETYKEYPL